jgi:hypothetical protein
MHHDDNTADRRMASVEGMSPIVDNAATLAGRQRPSKLLGIDLLRRVQRHREEDKQKQHAETNNTHPIAPTIHGRRDFQSPPLTQSNITIQSTIIVS